MYSRSTVKEIHTDEKYSKIEVRENKDKHTIKICTLDQNAVGIHIEASLSLK